MPAPARQEMQAADTADDRVNSAHTGAVHSHGGSARSPRPAHLDATDLDHLDAAPAERAHEGGDHGVTLGACAEKFGGRDQRVGCR